MTDTELQAAIDADLAAAPRIYFLYLDGLIKIGTSTNVEQRVAAIKNPASRTAAPFERHRLGYAQLVGTVLGGRRAEAHLHRRFATYRAAGEWFYLAKDLATFIEAITDDGLRRNAPGRIQYANDIARDMASGASALPYRVADWPTIPDDICRDLAHLIDAPTTRAS